MKPIIGITCNFDVDNAVGVVTRFGFAEQDFHMLADEYIRAVENAGGIPVMIPICSDFETVKELISRVDGVLISGGNDVDPTLYGEFITKECGSLMPQRDTQDIMITNYVMKETQKPLLGICRGIQILNVARGGTLYQDLGKAGRFDHFVACSPITHPVHTVQITEGTLLSDIIGDSMLAVNSYHHQAVKNVAEGFVVSAKALDGTIESIEFPGDQMVLGVQWHPEMLYTNEMNQRIIRRFVSAALIN